MNVSDDYAVRILSLTTNQVPLLKEDVTDEIFYQIMCVLGKSQRFLDISRCMELRPLSFNQLSICESLTYVDISYTRIIDLSPIIENCLGIKAICLAGLDLTQKQYDSVGKLVNLEYLTLRQSNINSIDCCQYLYMLRSLNLGYTSISSISCLGGNNFTRLEELVLDGCKNLAFENFNDHLKIISDIPNLGTLNVCETDLLKNIDKIFDLHPNYNLSIESRNRREIFIEAIMEGDEQNVSNLLADGADVNLRLGTWAKTIMVNMWRKHCKSGRVQTPCYIVDHENEELRPYPIHIAILKGNLNIIKMIYFNGANMNSSVIFTDVLDENNNLIVDEKLASTRTAIEFDTLELSKIMFERNVHRVTLGHIANKTPDWKAIVTELYNNIEELFNNPFEFITPKDLTLKTDSKKKIQHKNSNNDTKIETNNESKNDDINIMDQSNTFEIGEVSESLKIEKKKRKKMVKTLPKFNRLDWRKHGMVYKLNGDPCLVYSSIFKSDISSINILGKKDFWLERKTQVLYEKLKYEDKLFLDAYRSKLSITESNGDTEENREIINQLNKELVRFKKGIGSYGKKKKFEAAYRPARDDVTARKSYLKSLLEEKIALKYKVRDDLEDMTEENETLNPAIIIDDSSITTTTTNTTHSESLK